MTGEVIRSSRATAHRYERDRPGELVHVDVKKIGRIPEDGGWRAHGRRERPNAKRGTGYDYVHSMIDDHSRLAYSEILPDERGTTCTAFFDRAITWFDSVGVKVESVITDNAMCYRRCRELHTLLEVLGVAHLFIKPYCPWQNGKVERFNRTLQIEWAYRQVFNSNEDRSNALAPWLSRYNYERPHSSIGGKPPISRLTPT